MPGGLLDGPEVFDRHGPPHSPKHFSAESTTPKHFSVDFTRQYSKDESTRQTGARPLARCCVKELPRSSACICSRWNRLLDRVVLTRSPESRSKFQATVCRIRKGAQVSLLGNSCQRCLSAPAAAAQWMPTKTAVRGSYGARKIRTRSATNSKVVHSGVPNR